MASMGATISFLFNNNKGVKLRGAMLMAFSLNFI
jgi:hypothetical protein